MARKTTRRKPNTGTIRTKAGRALPWEAAFPLGHGQHRYDSFATRAEAETHLDQLTEERDNKDIKRDIAAGSTRFDVFASTWLSIKAGRVKETTFVAYQYLVELAIEQWAARRMDEIHRPQADALMSYFGSKEFKDITQLRMVLSQIFKYAMEVNAIRKNPFMNAKPPIVEHRPTVALTQVQRTRLLEAAETLDKPNIPLFPMWHLFSRVGLRRGEAVGLRWQDVNVDEGTISIVQQYVYVRGEMKKSTPKTKRSTRTIPLPEDILDFLSQHRDRQRIIQSRATTWIDLDLVFCNPDGSPIENHTLQTAWKKIRRTAQLPKETTIHSLRHTAQHLMEVQHVPISSRMAILGHSTATMAIHYADHADMTALRAATKKMG